MKKIIYSFCLLAALIGGGSIVLPFVLLATYVSGGNTSVLFILSKILSIIAFLVPMLAVFRIFIIIKARSFLLPQKFRGAIYVYSILMLLPGIIVTLGYFYLGFSQKVTGVSGIPLAYTYFGIAILLAIPVLYCEFIKFYKCIPGKNSNKSAQSVATGLSR